MDGMWDRLEIGLEHHKRVTQLALVRPLKKPCGQENVFYKLWRSRFFWNVSNRDTSLFTFFHALNGALYLCVAFYDIFLVRCGPLTPLALRGAFPTSSLVGLSAWLKRVWTLHHCKCFSCQVRRFRLTLFILVFWLLCSEDYKRKTQNFKSDLTHSTNSVWCLSWTSNMGNLEAVWCMRLHGIRLGCIVYVPAVASNKYDTATNWICLKLHVLSSLGKLLLKPSRRLIWEHGKGQGMFELYGFPSCACWCDTAMFALKDYRLNSYWMLHVCSWPRSSQRSPIVLCGHVD